MKFFFALLSAASLLVAGAASAVSLDTSGRNAQVLIFPLFTTAGSNLTDFTVRNHTDAGKALKVITKDALGGRPTMSVNVYLKPGDSWNAQLIAFPAFSASLISDDESCTVPVLGRRSATSAHLDGNLNQDRVGRSQLNTGYIEIFEMGEIAPELAADCDAIRARFADGVWSTGEVMVNEDVSAPGGGLSGVSFIKDTAEGRTLALHPTGLADFSDQPNHTVSQRGGRPSLANVMPAQAELNGQTLTFQGNPINAVEAVLMTQQLSAEYRSDEESRAFAFATVLLPTRPFHANPGFYRSFTASPFDPQDNVVVGNLVDSTGDRLDALPEPTAGELCDRYTGAVNFVQLINFFNFSHICELGDAELFLFDDDTRGTLELPLSGTLTADDGTVLSGLPAIGHLMQTYIAPTSDRELGAYALPMYRN